MSHPCDSANSIASSTSFFGCRGLPATSTEYNAALCCVNRELVGRAPTGQRETSPCTVQNVPRQSLGALIDEITVDAHDVGEQLMGFLQVFQDEVELPADATVIGVPIVVAGFDMEGDERRGLVARCKDGSGAGTISLADVCFEPGSMAAWLHAAYRTWLCLRPFSARRPSDWSWPS